MICFYMMSAGKHPFLAADDAGVKSNILSNSWDKSSVKDSLGVDLVERMLEDNPSDRPSAEALLK